MNLLLALFFSLLPAQYLDRAPLTPMAFDGKAFLETFNRASDRPRLVAIFSPT